MYNISHFWKCYNFACTSVHTEVIFVKAINLIISLMNAKKNKLWKLLGRSQFCQNVNG